VDVINCAKFYRNRLRDFDFVRGRFDHFHWIAISPLTLVDDRPPVILAYEYASYFTCSYVHEIIAIFKALSYMT